MDNENERERVDRESELDDWMDMKKKREMDGQIGKKKEREGEEKIRR